MNHAVITKRRIGLTVFGLALLSGLAFVVQRAGPLAPVRVTSVRATEDRLTPALFGLGTVEARRSYLIGPTTAGRVRSVDVEVGDRVQAGQVLAEMDPVDLDARLHALDAAIERAGSAITAAEAQLRDAEARRTLAQGNARRYEALAARDLVSASAVEACVQEQCSAESGVAAAAANLSGARQERTRAIAERAAAQRLRASARLVAPAAALVTSRDAEPGSTVVAGQAVVRAIDPAALWIRVRIDQGRSTGLVKGLSARIVLRSRPGTVLDGMVERVESVSDSVTEERLAIVSFDRPPDALSVGESAEVTLSLPTTPPAVVLPTAAIRRLRGETGVWTIDGTSIRFAPVRLGQTGLDGRVQVLQGLDAGTQVVAHSAQALHGDRRIEVVDALQDPQP